ncbi:MAG: NAD(P)H-dependent glycerol-3-phosphate dehydrogenase [Bacillota bacterium]|nr:NAD(P)H-dependent glycerol-3-phosphate dehydrogenase [Bacillota bacterium]
MRIKILGAGSWGTALSLLLYYNGHNVSLWSWDGDHVEALLKDGENKVFLPGVALPPDLLISKHISGVKSAELVVFSVPSPAIKSVAEQAAEFIRPHTVLVSAAKGFVPGGHSRISEVLRQIFPNNPVVTLSGPSHAEEVARNLPTTVVVAGDDPEALQVVQDTFMSSAFRVYTNNDIIGVEVAGAVKNIIALGAGVIDGLGQGDNAKAALITRGLAEITRLGVAMGANPATFSGLAGIGDLVVTCTSHHSRNYRAGREIGHGRPWNQVVDDMAMVVEGVYATEAAYHLAEKYHVDMPITDQIYHMLYEGRSPREAMWALMTRAKAAEEIY